MDILVIQPMRASGAEAVGAALVEAGARLDIRGPEDGDGLPADAAGHDGLVVLGGVANANQDDEYPYLAPAVRLIGEFHGAAKPVLGICLGAQLIARALGGRAHRHTVPEMGFVPVTLTPEAGADPLLAGLASPQQLFEWHDDTVELPPGARLLATSAACRNQAFRVGQACYGFQCHFEITRPLVESWVAATRESRHDPAHIDFFARIGGELERFEADSLAFCRTVTGRWAALVRQRQAA